MKVQYEHSIGLTEIDRISTLTHDDPSHRHDALHLFLYFKLCNDGIALPTNEEVVGEPIRSVIVIARPVLRY